VLRHVWSHLLLWQAVNPPIHYAAPPNMLLAVLLSFVLCEFIVMPCVYCREGCTKQYIFCYMYGPSHCNFGNMFCTPACVLQGGLHRAVHLQWLQGPCCVPHPVAAACTAALQALQADVDLPHGTQLLVGSMLHDHLIGVHMPALHPIHKQVTC
jgi:hypothetical protein